MEESKMRTFSLEEQYFPCTDVDAKYTQACYFEMPSWWLASNNLDYQKAGLLCEGVSDETDKTACYRGAGNSIAGMTKYSLNDIAQACRLMPNKEGEVLCIEGATWIVSAQPEFKDVWRELCEPYSEDEEYYERCIKSHDFI
jgi:hypothetical protein